MITLGGLVLIAAALFMGFPGDVRYYPPDTGQLLLIAGVAVSSFNLMVNNPKLLDVMPLMIGAAVMGAGAYYDDIWGMVGGVAILSANWYGVIRRRRRSY
jgi:hypothetical protein